MIVHENLKHAGGFLDRFGETDVRIRRLDMSGRVIVNEDHCRGLLPQGIFENLSWVDNGLIDDAHLKRFHVDELILGIKIDNAKLFIFQAAPALFCNNSAVLRYRKFAFSAWPLLLGKERRLLLPV